MALNNKKKLIVIFGMGAGNGLAIAKKFGIEGFQVVMVSRDVSSLTSYGIQLAALDIQATPYNIDIANERSLEKLLKQISKKHGVPEVVVYNASTNKLKNILEESAESLVNDFKINVVGAFAVTKYFWPQMADKNGGVIFYTGGGLALNPIPEYGSLAIGKAALRSLTYSVAKTLEHKNIHVATITIMEKLNPTHPKYNSTAVADKMWELYLQPRGRFNTEIQW